MPIFEYRCTGCGRIFEEIAKQGQETVEWNCPICGVREGKRILSAFATVTKGSSAPPCGSQASQCGLGGDTGHGACSCCGGGAHHH